jgi:hypothetical protein
VPFLRVTRDQRGYETTFLLHAGYAGARPRVLYWYRSAPGIRVGRTPLDEDAIRAIEERYPDLEFDWPSLIEQSTALPPEIERRQERPRRKAPRPAPEPTRAGATAPIDDDEDEPPSPTVPSASAADTRAMTRPSASPPSTLLDELVGREIAGRLRARYAEVLARLSDADPSRRDEWQSRAAVLDPDSWRTPEEILHGVEHADERFDELKAEMG